MAEDIKHKEEAQDKKFRIGMVLFTVILAIVILGAATICIINDSDLTKATNNDIDGDWNSTLTTHSYVFIPKSNIDSLEFTFSIRDKSGKELQRIVKKVGDVKKGQQYTVSFSATEIKDFATLMNSDYTSLTVTGGKRKLI